MNIQKLFIKTQRQERVAYLRQGNPQNPKKLLLVHGNVSASGFYVPLMARLADSYDVIAIDLNGYGATKERPIAAPTALLDWSEDIDAFMQALNINKFAICGWSLGGGVVMKYAINHADKLTKIILISPMSPYGFGGTYDVDGKMIDSRGLGCGGAFVNPAFLKSLIAKDLGDGPTSPRFIMNNHYFKPGFKVSKELEDLFVSEMLAIRIGEDYYAGNIVQTTEFPYLLPGTRGTNNALAPQYANVSGIMNNKIKPEILWFHGDCDMIVNDNSVYDLPVLGKMGLIPGYPGEDKMPHQPMLKQTRYVLEQYKKNGGKYEEFLVKDAGHSCHIEKEDYFVKEIKSRV